MGCPSGMPPSCMCSCGIGCSGHGGVLGVEGVVELAAGADGSAASVRELVVSLAHAAVQTAAAATRAAAAIAWVRCRIGWCTPRRGCKARTGHQPVARLPSAHVVFGATQRIAGGARRRLCGASDAPHDSTVNEVRLGLALFIVLAASGAACAAESVSTPPSSPANPAGPEAPSQPVEAASGAVSSSVPAVHDGGAE